MSSDPQTQARELDHLVAMNVASDMADRLHSAYQVAHHLGALGARIEFLHAPARQPATFYLAHPGSLPDELDRQQISHHLGGGHHTAYYQGCRVCWFSAASAADHP